MADRHNMGPSRFIPKVKGEDWFKRHKRRAEINDENAERVANWCSKHFVVFDDGVDELWHFYTEGKHATWCPFNASLVLNGNIGDSLHIHDYKVLLQTICRYFGVPQPSPFDLANYTHKRKRS